MSGIDVWSRGTNDIELSFDVALSVLSPDECMRAERYRDEAKRQRWAASRCFLRQVLSRYVDEPPEAIRFDRLPQGKLVLSDHPSLHFSLSHAGELTVVAVTTTNPVGVDIEPLRPYAELTGAVAISMTPRERDILDALPASKRARWFLHGWTCKEAILKATGAGIDDQLLKLEVSLDPNVPRVVAWDNRYEENWFLQTFAPDKRHIGAIAMKSQGTHEINVVQRTLG
ncbi:MAG: 4'-phosphopantetheinyl transferase superfamily protein [Planctomycetaceae bacterium]|nr:4'-phosphopantetheinyl transferase superfamily protein [Planctomycetaceae bacterium]